MMWVCVCVCVLQAVSREFICEECQNSTLNKLESMLEILQTDTKQGTVTPTEIADNILNIMGRKHFLSLCKCTSFRSLPKQSTRRQKAVLFGKA